MNLKIENKSKRIGENNACKIKVTGKSTRQPLPAAVNFLIDDRHIAIDSYESKICRFAKTMKLSICVYFTHTRFSKAKRNVFSKWQ